MTEKQKMLAGQTYDSLDRELAMERKATKIHLSNYNKTLESENFRRQRFLRRLFGKVGNNPNIEPPIYFEYGLNTYIGDNFFCGVGLTVLDMGRVSIGDNCFFGPNVSISTQIRSFYPSERRLKSKSKKNIPSLFEYTRPVRIGNDVWIGSNVVINPGSSIGDGSVIMGGSVVTGSIPPNSIAAGFPCKVLREVSESDKILSEAILSDYFEVLPPDSFQNQNISEDIDPEDHSYSVKNSEESNQLDQIGDEEIMASEHSNDKVSAHDTTAEENNISNAGDLLRTINSEDIENEYHEKMFTFE